MAQPALMEMAPMYPWQSHRESWSETCPSMAIALEALQQACYARHRWQETSRASWDEAGLRFSFHWHATRRFPGRRQAWSDGSFLDSFRSGWNRIVIDIRDAEAAKRGNHTYRQVSLPHEFELEITLAAPRAGTATAEFVLTEEIDPDQTVTSFQHGSEAVASRLSEVVGEIRSAFNPHHLPAPRRSSEANGSGMIRRLTPTQVKSVVGETMDRCVTEGWLPPYERSGKFQPPRHKSPIVGPPAWLLAHYAQQAGPLYDDEPAWRLAHDLIESFMAKGVAAGNLTCDLPRVFGTLKGVAESQLSGDLPMLFGQCGFSAGPAAAGASVFHARGSSTICDLPEPYGKWLQLRELSPCWEDKVELEMVVHAKVDPDPKSGDACLSLQMSTFAPTVVERLALAIEQRYRLTVAVPTPRPPNRLLTPPRPPRVVARIAPPKTTRGRIHRLSPGKWKF